VIVLAGDRGRDDPLARAHGVAGKALVPAAGRALLTRVLDTLATMPELHPVRIVAPSAAAFQAAADASRLPRAARQWLAPAGSPAASVAMALEAGVRDDGVVLVTADHPLLKPAWVHALCEGALRDDADVAVALVPWARVAERFPGGRRTRLAFADGAMCGTNLFRLRRPAADAAVRLWRRVERERKRPWRLAAMLGPRLLAGYLTGRLERTRAFELLSRRAGARVTAVLLDDGESAVDVDCTIDLELVERVLHARGDAGGGA